MWFSFPAKRSLCVKPSLGQVHWPMKGYPDSGYPGNFSLVETGIHVIVLVLYYNLIALEQWYFSIIWNTYMWKLQNYCGWLYKQIIAWFAHDIWHTYHSWHLKIVSNFTHLTAREIRFNNFEISLVVFLPNITTNHAVICTNPESWALESVIKFKESESH